MSPESAHKNSRIKCAPSRIAMIALYASTMFALSFASRSIAAQTGAANPTKSDTPPAFILGNFDDDYGGHFAISATNFIQLPRGKFNIVKWNAADQYFIAQNDSLNRNDPNKWTRIDWIPLKDMAPYTWAFCFSAYKAETRAEAESAAVAKHDTPKSGCNGFPFTRMKPTPQ